MMTNKDESALLTFGGHLEVLRKMLFRMIMVIAIFAIAIFCLKDETFHLLLAPSEWDFVTYRGIERLFSLVGYEFHFNEFHVDLIATDLSSQFMTHLSTSLCLGLLCSSPYILYELFRFVSPALYESERKYSVPIVFITYGLFIIGVLMSYFVIFPVSFRFLGTYSVAEKVHSTITLDSYISTFTTLTLVMGLVFQLPIIAYILAKMGLIDTELLSKYRKHALIIIMLLSAIITPPDLMTLILVALPLYMLYEVSIRIIKHVHKT
jgi:sec-independent protein translocase protein TatC